MKLKKSLSKVLIYALMFTALNVVVISEKVQALEGYSTYSKECAGYGNIYNIIGDILKVEQYADYTLAVTEKTIYFIENGQAKKYDLGEIEILSSTTITRDGNYIYLTPCRKNKEYILLTIDKEKLQGTEKPISNYMPYENYSSNILLQDLTFKDAVIDYEIADDGSIWVIYEDKIIHSKADGEIQREYKGTYVKDICKDILGNIWVLEDNRVLQLVDHEFKLEYEVRSESKELSVRDKNNIAIRNIDGITRIAKGQREEIYVSSYNDVAVGAVPENYEDKTTIIDEEVHESKEWVIKFNQQLDKTTVNESNIIVVNSSGEKQNMKVFLDNDNLSIKLTTEKNYANGESYYIIIKETIKSLSGKQLSKPMLVKFVVEDNKTRDDNLILVSELDKIKFEIEIPARLGTRDKSFIDYVVSNWRKSYEEEAKAKGEILKVGKATILKVSVGTSTAYISFDVEIHAANSKEIVKEVKHIDLNCKKQDGVWQIIN